MSEDSSETLKSAQEMMASVVKATAPPAPKPKSYRPHQFKPGLRLVDSYKRQYYVDQNCSLRRVEGGKLTKAEKKAAKRQRRREHG